METYHERKAREAYETYAAPFVERTRLAYRQCASAADLHKLSKACWREANNAARTINRNGYDNFTRHGTAPYDRYDALHSQAREYAIAFYKKALRIEAGEAPETVMPHLAKKDA